MQQRAELDALGDFLKGTAMGEENDRPPNRHKRRTAAAILRRQERRRQKRLKSQDRVAEEVLERGTDHDQ